MEEYRRHLGAFGLTGDMTLQPVGSLSGGQKSRVAFAKMCLSLPNFLILDEPTNHLDIETIEALGKAIQKYSVSIIERRRYSALTVLITSRFDVGRRYSGFTRRKIDS